MSEKLRGGRADGKSAKDFDPEDLAEGMRVEREHTKDPQMQREIARDHFVEDPDYYKKLKRIEKAKDFDPQEPIRPVPAKKMPPLRRRGERLERDEGERVMPLTLPQTQPKAPPPPPKARKQEKSMNLVKSVLEGNLTTSQALKGLGTGEQVELLRELRKARQQGLFGESAEMRGVRGPKAQQTEMFGGGAAKPGEGSRGGKVIGHTKTGKAIYDQPHHPSHAGFSAGEQKEAEEHNQKIGWEKIPESKEGGWRRKGAKIGDGPSGPIHEYEHSYPGGKPKQPSLFEKSEQMSVHLDQSVAAQKPPAGFIPIPGSKHGGYHKKVGARFVYWYPCEGESSAPKKEEPPEVHEMHAVMQEKAKPVDFVIEKAKGYLGKKSGRSYIAKISGESTQYGLDRSFLKPDDVDWGDSQLYKKNKGTWTETYSLPHGLYEVSEFGDKQLWMVYFHTEKKKNVRSKVDAARANAIAKKMSEGDDFESARMATKPESVAKAKDADPLSKVDLGTWTPGGMSGTGAAPRGMRPGEAKPLGKTPQQSGYHAKKMGMPTATGEAAPVAKADFHPAAEAMAVKKPRPASTASSGYWSMDPAVKGGPPAGSFKRIKEKIMSGKGKKPDDPDAVAAKVYRQKYGSETLARRSAGARKSLEAVMAGEMTLRKALEPLGTLEQVDFLRELRKAKAQELEKHPAMKGDWTAARPYRSLASEHRRTAQELLEAHTPGEDATAKEFSGAAMKRHGELTGKTEKSMQPAGSKPKDPIMKKKTDKAKPSISDKRGPDERKKASGQKPQLMEEETPEPGSLEYHRDKALAHLAAAQAHANAHASAKKLAETGDHDQKVKEAETSTQQVISKGGVDVHLGADDEIVKYLEGAEIGIVPSALADPRGPQRLAALRGEHLAKGGVAGGTIYQGEHDEPRGGDLRETVARAKVEMETVEDDPAGNHGQGGLSEWFKDSYDGSPQVNVPVGVAKIIRKSDEMVVIDDDSPYHRALQQMDTRDSAAGMRMAYEGNGRENLKE